MSNEKIEAGKLLHKAQSDLGKAINLMETDTQAMVDANGKPVVPEAAP